VAWLHGKQGDIRTLNPTEERFLLVNTPLWSALGLDRYGFHALRSSSELLRRRRYMVVVSSGRLDEGGYSAGTITHVQARGC
jgi:hypothetical protein